MLVKLSYKDIWIDAIKISKSTIMGKRDISKILRNLKKQRKKIIEDFKKHYGYSTKDNDDHNLTMKIIINSKLDQDSSGNYLLYEGESVTLTAETFKKGISKIPLLYGWSDGQKPIGNRKSITIDSRYLKDEIHHISVIVREDKDTNNTESIATISIKGVMTKSLHISLAPYPNMIEDGQSLSLKITKPSNNKVTSYRWYQWSGNRYSQNIFCQKRSCSIGSINVGVGGVIKMRVEVISKDGHRGILETREVRVVAKKQNPNIRDEDDSKIENEDANIVDDTDHSKVEDDTLDTPSKDDKNDKDSNKIELVKPNNSSEIINTTPNEQISDNSDNSSSNSNQIKIALHVTAPSNWKGKIDEDGFSFTRDEESGASRKYPAMCYSQAGEGLFKYVNGTVSAKLTGITPPSVISDLWSQDSITLKDIKNSLSKDMKKNQRIKSIQISNFKGYILENKISYHSGGCSISGFWNAKSTKSGYGVLTDGKQYLKVAYNGNARGFYDNGDRAWVTSHTKMASREAEAILHSISIGHTPKRVTTKYVRLPDLVVNLSSSIEKPGAGDLVDLDVDVSGLIQGESITDYKWTGNLGREGDGNKNQAIFTATEPKKYTVTVTITTSKGRSESSSITFDIKKPIVTIEADKKEIFMGSEVRLTAKVKDGGDGELAWFLWQPYTDISFNPFEGHSGITKVKFPAPGRYKVWVELHQKSVSTNTKLAQSKQIEIDVKGIDLKLSAEPISPMVGEEVTIKADIQQKVDPNLIRIIWDHNGKVKEGKSSADGLSYSFFPTDTTPIKVSIKVLAVEDNLKELISKTITITAKKYKLSISTPKRKGKAPWIWDAKQGKAVELPQAISVFQDAEIHSTITPKPKTKVHYRWSIIPDGCTISSPMSQSTNLNAHKKGTYQVSLKVTDKNGIVLGKATTSYSVTVSQRDLDVAKQKAKDQIKAKELLKEARKLWKDGKLQLAIAKIYQAQKLTIKDKEINKTLKAMTKQKKQIDNRLLKASKLIKQNRLNEAKVVLDKAAIISNKYKRYKEVSKELADAKQKEKKKKKLLADIIAKAKVLKKTGRLNEATKVLQDGIKQFPNNKEIAKLLKEIKRLQSDANKKMAQGQIEWRNGQLDKAISILKKASEIDPSNSKIIKVSKWMQKQKRIMDDILVEVDRLIKEKKFTQAKEVLKRAVRISNRYPSYIEMVKKLNLEKIKSQKIINDLLKKAKDIWNRGKLDEAITILTKANREFASNQKIIKSLQKMRQDKKSIDMIVNQSLQLINQKKFDKAESLLKKAGDISTKYPPYIKAIEKLNQEKKAEKERADREKAEAKKVQDAKDKAAADKMAKEKKAFNDSKDNAIKISDILIDQLDKFKSDNDIKIDQNTIDDYEEVIKTATKKINIATTASEIEEILSDLKDKTEIFVESTIDSKTIDNKPSTILDTEGIDGIEDIGDTDSGDTIIADKSDSGYRSSHSNIGAFSGILTQSSPSATHKIMMPSDGKLNITITTGPKLNFYGGIHLKDSDNKTYISNNIGQGPNSTKTWSFNMLRAGVYYLDLTKDGRNFYYGPYSVTTSIDTQKFANDSEDNNDFERANFIKFGQTVSGQLGVIGQLKPVDVVDYWRVNIPQSGEIEVDVTTSEHLNLYGGVTLYDNEKKIIYNTTPQGPNSNKKHITNKVKVGTYYIKIEKDHRGFYWGSYQMSISLINKKRSVKTDTTKVKTSNKVTPKKIKLTTTKESYGGSDGTITSNITLTFWNVGAKVSGYGRAELDVVSVSSNGKKQHHHYSGTFDGGRNGDMELSDGDITVHISLIGGKKAIFDGQGFSIKIPNPSVFD